MDFSFWLVVLIAQTPLPSAGVLIGIRNDSGYYTMAVPANPDAPSVRVPGLIVPRDGELWRFDVARTCYVQTGSEYSDSSTFINREQVVTRQRIGSDSVM